MVSSSDAALGDEEQGHASLGPSVARDEEQEQLEMQAAHEAWSRQVSHTVIRLMQDAACGRLKQMRAGMAAWKSSLGVVTASELAKANARMQSRSLLSRGGPQDSRLAAFTRTWQTQESTAALGSLSNVNDSDDEQSDAREGGSDFAQKDRARRLPATIIHPGHPGKVIWDLIIGLLILYCIVMVPIREGFRVPATGTWLVVEYAFDGLFLLDIIVTFNTAVYYGSGGDIISSRAAIAKQYVFGGMFWVDLLSTIPFDLIIDLISQSLMASSDSGGRLSVLRTLRVVRVIRVLKLLRVLKLSRICSHRTLQDDGKCCQCLKWQSWSLVAVCAFVGHLMCCLWFASGLFSLEIILSPDGWAADNGSSTGAVYFTAGTSEILKAAEAAGVSSWVYQYDVNGGNGSSPVIDSDLSTQYVTSLYWAFTTMSTLGYGDITPTNHVEQVVAIVCMLVGVLVFGYIIGRLTALIEESSMELTEKQRKRDEVTDFCRAHNLSADLEQRIMKLINYQLRETWQFSQDVTETTILTSLPAGIRQDVLRGIAAKYFDDFSFFSQLGDEFKYEMSVRLQPMLFLEKEVIIQEGMVCDCVMFIMSGEVAVLRRREESRLEELRENASAQDREQWWEDVLNRGIDYDSPTALLSSGDVIGVRGVICNTKRDSTCVALDRVSMMFCSEADFEHCMDLFPEDAAILRDQAEALKSVQGGKHRATHARSTWRRASLMNGFGSVTPTRRSPSPSGSATVDELSNQPLSGSVVSRGHTHGSGSGLGAKAVQRRSSLDPFLIQDENAASNVRQRIEDKKAVHAADKVKRRGLCAPYDPSGRRMKLFQSLLTVTVLYTVIIVPVRIGFNAPASGALLILELCIDLLFIIDICVTFNTAIVRADGTLELDRRKIIWVYVSNPKRFICDLLSSVPWVEVLSMYFRFSGQANSTTNVPVVVTVLGILRMLKLYRLTTLLDTTRQWVLDGWVSGTKMRLFLFFFGLLFTAHLVGCLYYYMAFMVHQWTDATNLDGVEATWADAFGDMRDDISQEYVSSLYWAITLLTTVGYGDILPVNDWERLFNIFSMLLGAVMLGMLVGAINAFAEEWDRSSKHNKLEVKALNQWMQWRQLHPNLKRRIRMAYMDKKKYGLGFDGGQHAVMSYLTPMLRKEVAGQMTMTVIKQMPFLMDEHTDAQFLSMLCSKLKPQAHMLDDIIVEEQGKSNFTMFFLTQGRVRVERQYKRSADTTIRSGPSLRMQRQASHLRRDDRDFDSLETIDRSQLEQIPESQRKHNRHTLIGGSFFLEGDIVMDADYPQRYRASVIAASETCVTFAFSRSDLHELMTEITALPGRQLLLSELKDFMTRHFEHSSASCKTGCKSSPLLQHPSRDLNWKRFFAKIDNDIQAADPSPALRPVASTQLIDSTDISSTKVVKDGDGGSGLMGSSLKVADAASKSLAPAHDLERPPAVAASETANGEKNASTTETHLSLQDVQLAASPQMNKDSPESMFKVIDEVPQPESLSDDDEDEALDLVTSSEETATEDDDDTDNQFEL